MADRGAPLLQIWTLGRLEIRLHGALVRGFSTRKAEALLVYLAYYAGRSQTRAHLQALLWSDSSPDQAAASLRQALSNLRRLLPAGALRLEAQSVAWNGQLPIWLDAHQIEAEPALYQGEFLAGMALANASLWDEWLGAQREAILLRLLYKLEDLAEQAKRQRRFADAERYYQRILELEPWRESVHLRLMRLYALQGERAKALMQYEACRAALAEELDVLPGAETEALLVRIQAETTATASALPHFATPFIGRQAARVRLGEMLLDPNCRLLTLTGPGGSGKTRLAVQCVAENSYAFLQGAIFVPLAALTDSTALPTVIAVACGLTLRGAQTPSAQLCNYLSDREMLLLLDAFEQLVEKPDAIQLIARILQAAPHCKIVVTSQVYLNTPWEWLFEVDGLAVAAEGDEHDDGGEAAALFVYHARRVSPHFTVDEETKASVAHICRLVQGLPLALELAAAALRLFTCAEIAMNLASHLDFLSTSHESTSAHQHSLVAVFDYSWNLLDGVEQRALAHCAIFRGAFTHAAAYQIAGASRQALAGLERKSFVRRLAEGRLDIHPVLRRFAAERLHHDPAAAEEIEARHANFYLQFLTRQAVRMSSDHGALDELSAGLDEVRAAWLWAVDRGDLALLAGAVEGWGVYFNHRAWYREGLQGLRAALVRFEEGGAAWRPHLLAWMHLESMLLRNLGWFVQEKEVAERRVRFCRQAENQRELFFAVHNLAEIMRLAGDFEQARQLAGECLVLAPPVAGGADSHALRCQAEAQHLLGVIAATLGDDATATARFAEALEFFAGAERVLGVAMCQSELGVVHRRHNNSTLARHYFEQARQGFAQIGYLRGVVVTDLDLARLRYQAGDLRGAHQLASQSRSAFRQMDYALGVAQTVQILGEIASAAGQVSEARLYFAEMLAIAGTLAVPLRQIELLPGLLRYWRVIGAEENRRWLAQILAAHAASPYWVRQQAAEALAERGELLFAAGAANSQIPKLRQVVAEAAARL